MALVLVVRNLLPTRSTADAHRPSPRRFIAIACGAMLVLTVLPHIFGHNQNARYMLGALPVLALLLAAGSGPFLGLAMAGVASVQAAIMLVFIATGPYAVDGSDTLYGTTLLTNSWRNNPTCDFTGPIRAVAAHVARPQVRFYGITAAINHVQIQAAFLRQGILADVASIDLSRPDRADPARAGADLVMVLDTPEKSDYRNGIADPDAGLGAVREALLHSTTYQRSDARVFGPVAQCGMTSFLARRP